MLRPRFTSGFALAETSHHVRFACGVYIWVNCDIVISLNGENYMGVCGHIQLRRNDILPCGSAHAFVEPGMAKIKGVIRHASYRARLRSCGASLQTRHAKHFAKSLHFTIEERSGNSASGASDRLRSKPVPQLSAATCTSSLDDRGEHRRESRSTVLFGALAFGKALHARPPAPNRRQ